MRTAVLLGLIAILATSAHGQARQRLRVLNPAPTALTVTAGPAGAQSSWTPAPGSSGSIVQRSTDGVAFTPITQPITAASFVDNDVAPGTTVYYNVIGVFSTGNSAPSPAATYTAPATIVKAPISSVAANSFKSARLSAKSAPPPTSPVTIVAPNLIIEGRGYAAVVDIYFQGTAPTMRLYRQLGRLPREEVNVRQWSAGAQPNARTFDFGLQLNSTYFYKILSTLADGTEVWSNEIQLDTPRLDLAVTYLAQPSRIRLEWNNFGSVGEYTIQKKSTNTPSWMTIKTTTGTDLVIKNTTGYEDTIVGPGQTFWYRVCGRIVRGGACAESAAAGVAVP